MDPHVIEIAAEVVARLKLPDTILEEMVRQIEIADFDTIEETNSTFVTRAVGIVYSLINHASDRPKVYTAMLMLEEHRSNAWHSDPLSIAALTFIHLIQRELMTSAGKNRKVWLRIRRRLESEMREATQDLTS
jgi:hypothetical protein